MTALCPHCGAPATVEHLRGNPECSAVAGRIAGVYAVSKRKEAYTGKAARAPVWKTCPHCGATMTSRAFWLHNCGFKQRRNRKKPEN